MTGIGISRSRVESLTAWMLDQAIKRGAVGADAVFFSTVSNSLSYRDGEPEENSYGVTGGIGLRIIGDSGRQGIAYSNNIGREAVADLVDWAHANCRNSEPEPGITLYSGTIDSDDDSLMQYDPRITEITAKERRDYCLEMNEIARSRDKRVASVRASSWSDGLAETFYATTTGLAGWKRMTSASCGVAVVLSDGDSYEMGSYGKGERRFDMLDPSLYARLAVDRTTALLGGKPVPTAKYTLLLEPEISASLVDEIGELFCASDIHKGRSMMAGKLGSVVASKAVTLIDDARIPARSGSSLFDGEGVPTGRTLLIDSGKAASFLYNLQYANIDGVGSTGNASRSLSGLPDVGTSNLILQSGDESLESLLSSTSKGIYVTELMGLHTINPVSGDFSLGAKGMAVNNGEMGQAVSGVTIAGNLFELLERIEAVGRDQEFFGSTAASTIVVGGMTVAGS